MRLLLDTHASIWAAIEPSRLSERSRSAIADLGNMRLLSAVVAWEIAIKLRSGKLTISGDLAELFESQVAALRLTELPIERKHAVAAASLPPIHKDPFDRLLIAQALVEDLTIVTADSAIREYGVATIW